MPKTFVIDTNVPRHNLAAGKYSRFLKGFVSGCRSQLIFFSRERLLKKRKFENFP